MVYLCSTPLAMTDTTIARTPKFPTETHFKVGISHRRSINFIGMRYFLENKMLLSPRCLYCRLTSMKTARNMYQLPALVQTLIIMLKKVYQYQTSRLIVCSLKKGLSLRDRIHGFRQTFMAGFTLKLDTLQ